MKTSKHLLLALPLAFVVACSSDSDNDEEYTEKTYPIIVSATERPIANPSAPKNSMRRAPITTTSSLNNFNLFFWNDDKKEFGGLGTFSKTSDTHWKGDQNWPDGYTGNDDEKDKVLTFYASNAVFQNDECTFFSNDGEACIDVHVDEASNEQVDLLAAKNAVSYSSCGGVVPLEFDHISAAVQVSLCKTDKLSGYTVVVSEVILHNIMCHGEYYFDQDIWKPYVSEAAPLTDYTITAYKQEQGGLTVTTTPQPLAKSGDYLFLLPQTLTGWNKKSPLKDSYIEIKCKIFNSKGNMFDSSDSYGSVYLPLDATLKMGMINSLNISMGTALRDSNGDKIIF